jgi:ATP-binding cassette subfamily C protein CydD
MRVMRIAFLSSAVLEFFAALGVAGVALYVGLTFLDLVSLRGSTLTLEAGLFCLLMAPEVYQPLRLLAANYHDRAAAKAAASEIAGQLGALPEVDREEAENAVTLVDAPMRPIPVMLAGVAVESPSGRPVVEDVQLAVAAGAHVALLGPSGCGKSTLLEAIAGLREAKGAILLDGQALASIDEPRLRAGVAFLGQRPRIFAGTIAENIRFGRPDACDTAVALAARRACVDLFADGLPLGLATPLGENGLGLSGGEIQRIALARIYLRDPGLVLMDEPTAHLDAVTESAVIDGIVAFARGRTLIVATHSQAVAARMERVYRIAGRRVLPAPRPSAPGQAVRREAAA